MTEERTSKSEHPVPPAEPKRRPYVPPIIESGEAFERVQLQSGPGFADPIDCPPQ